ncbi:MAG TPA: ROK family protein [Planctomycetota bacterium]|nr:ROK family protein [Planctomycetota bacterium]
MAYLGIDLGGTYARAAIVDAQGRLVSSAKVALTDRAPEVVADAIARAAGEAGGGADVLGCGVGVAGMLDRDTGVVANAPNLGWRDVPFAKMLADRLGRPVRLVNDLAAAAWGEYKAGAGLGVQDVFVVMVGSGVGGAIIANGALVRGATGVAAEFGHVKVVPDGRRCGCGQRGCLEAYVGGHNLIAQMREALASATPTMLRDRTGGDATALTPIVLEAAALAGDAVAKAIYDPACAYLGMCIGSQITVLNPARLILGGGVLRRCPAMRAAVVDAIGRYATVVSSQALTVVESALGDDSGLIGAALLAAEG